MVDGNHSKPYHVMRKLTIDDLKIEGEVSKIDRHFIPNETDRIFYHLGQYTDAIKYKYKDKETGRPMQVHQWIDWEYSGYLEEVSHEFWNKYSNDTKLVSDEEITDHHKFIVLKPNDDIRKERYELYQELKKEFE